jgi:outer membrane protein
MNSKLRAGSIALWLAFAAVGGAQRPDVPQELTLEQAIAFGLKNSPTLLSAQAEIEAARAETRAAKAKTRPSLSLNGFANRSNMPSIMQSAMDVEPRALVMAPERTFYDVNLMFMTPLYTGGYLAGLVAAARAMERVAEAEASGMRAEVVLMIRESYLKALYGAELVEAQQSRLAAAEGMVANAKVQVEAGEGIEASVRRAEAELAEAKRDLAMLANDRQKMILDLLAEIGAPLDNVPHLTERLAFSPPTLNLEASIDAAHKSRGEVIAAEQRVAAAKGQITSAEGSQRPQIYGYAMGEAFSPKEGMGRNTGYSFGLAISLPLFDGGMRRAEINRARSMKDQAESELKRLKLLVEKEVRQAWLDINTAAANAETATAALKAAEEAYRVMVIRVETGKSILLEQLDGLAALTRARANLAQAIYEHQIAVARLDRAIGSVPAQIKGGLK